VISEHSCIEIGLGIAGGTPTLTVDSGRATDLNCEAAYELVV